MMKQVAKIACAGAMLFALSLQPVPALASDDTLGHFLSDCADDLIEPLCLVAISDAIDVATQMGDACIPDSVDDNQASRMVLQRLRTEVANQPDVAAHDSMDEEDKAVAALWPC